MTGHTGFGSAVRRLWRGLAEGAADISKAEGYASVAGDGDVNCPAGAGDQHRVATIRDDVQRGAGLDRRIAVRDQDRNDSTGVCCVRRSGPQCLHRSAAATAAAVVVKQIHDDRATTCVGAGEVDPCSGRHCDQSCSLHTGLIKPCPGGWPVARLLRGRQNRKRQGSRLRRRRASRRSAPRMVPNGATAIGDPVMPPIDDGRADSNHDDQTTRGGEDSYQAPRSRHVLHLPSLSAGCRCQHPRTTAGDP